jgi:beta-glucanase (GH16 family)
MLWTPGSAIFYGNGKELGRWESPRICSVQSAILLTHVMGGWEKESIDESQLPSDFTLDYVRVWQRKDLATAEDGPKPNSGGLGGTADDK